MKKLLFLLVLISSCSSANSINIEFQSDGKVKVDYRLSNPIQKVVFSEDGQQQRLMAWRLDSKCFAFDGQTVISTPKCESKKTFSIVFDAKKEMEFDRIYAMGTVFSDEKIWVLNLSKFIPTSPDKFLMTIKAPKGKILVFKGREYNSTIVTDTTQILQNSEYLYLGNVKLGKNKVAIALDNSLPIWMKNTLESSLENIYSFYEDKLDIKLNFKSVIAIAYYPDSANNIWKGDVDSSGNIFMRFYGKNWQTHDRLAEKTILRFLAHEIFHLFNSVQVRSIDASSRPWLHEGLAETFSAISLRELNLYSNADFNQYYQGALNKCNQYLVLKQAKVNQSATNKNYACGSLATLLLKQSDSLAKQFLSVYDRVATRDIYSVWKKLLSKEQGKQYSIDSYKNALIDYKYEEKLYLDLVEDAGDSKFMTDYLVKTNLPFKRSTSGSQQIIESLLNILLSQNCKRGYGFWLDERSLKVASGQDCGLPAMDFYVTHINGLDIFKDLNSLLPGITREATLSNSDGQQVKLKNNLDLTVFTQLKTIELNQ